MNVGDVVYVKTWKTWGTITSITSEYMPGFVATVTFFKPIDRDDLPGVSVSKWNFLFIDLEICKLGEVLYK